ncbi:CTP pyrophosphohydrolase [Vibrio aerogenes CECT 7868]|uniref:CTP pyrophosphohydrolase n=1 Tax=Vibrio aerogenes CECT 7868 TaxID=1216006 RepID=A0A1M6AN11_9VIBR|nr:NUDIX hydrolase [Vibrio aerogenes]SHI37890.1 CTP pyrophosphohydrolase [Vibrio aerogenes CECT 7868]
MKNLAMAVVIRAGKVLVQQRYRSLRGMVYEFPGGSVECEESGEEGACRELWEETGLKASQVLGTYQAVNEYGGMIDYVVINIASDAEPVCIDPVRQQTFFWMRPDDIPLNDFYAADRAFIRSHLPHYL